MNQNLKIMLAAEPVDLRKSFNGLYAVARNELGEVPEDGALFILPIVYETGSRFFASTARVAGSRPSV